MSGAVLEIEYSDNSTEVIQFGEGVMDGRRMCEVKVGDGVRVRVEPTHKSNNEAALRWAELIASSALARITVEAQTTAVQNENSDLRAKVQKLEALVADLRAVNEAAITGRRRFFTPVLLKPATPGAWNGEVWLLDPTKQERGFGLRFESLAEVRRSHPELWVVGIVDDGILLDGFGGAR